MAQDRYTLDLDVFIYAESDEEARAKSQAFIDRIKAEFNDEEYRPESTKLSKTPFGGSIRDVKDVPLDDPSSEAEASYFGIPKQPFEQDIHPQFDSNRYHEGSNGQSPPPPENPRRTQQ